MNYDQIAMWSQIASAIVFLAAFVGVWVKFISPAVLSAQEASNKQIADAVRHRDDAQAALTALHHEVAGAAHDADLIRKRAVDQAQREKDKDIADARDAGERALKNAQGELERARANAREAFRVELLEKALRQAQAEAATRVDEPMNAKLVDRFVSNLERVNDRG